MTPDQHRSHHELITVTKFVTINYTALESVMFIITVSVQDNLVSMMLVGNGMLRYQTKQFK